VALPRQVSLFLTATQFLTRLPVPAPENFQPSWLTHSARYFPLVGALVGAINVGVWWLCSRWFPPTVSVGLMIAASLLVTGAFHEDGFADTCDGFGGGTTPERVLSIMKDSRVGAYGAMGISMMLGLKWASLVAMPAAVFPLLVVSAHTMSRWCAIGLIWGLHYVRSEADGKAQPLANNLTGPEWMLSGVIGAVALAPLMLSGDVAPNGLTVRACAAAVLASMITAGVAGAYFKRRIGGYTGDCLGAVQQLSELSFLLAALATLAPTRPLG
jgi:adenosylcobinamide-GDP ribazoletransferase